MKVGIIGGAFVPVEKLSEFYVPQNCELLVRGDTELGKKVVEYAKSRNLVVSFYMPDSSLYGKGAGVMCDTEIVNSADVIIIYCSSKGDGYSSFYDYCRRLGKEVSIIYF